jgi:hypothetical protein
MTMTQENVESNPDVQDPEQAAPGTDSQQQDDKQTSQNDVLLERLFSNPKFDKKLDDLAQRKAQSTKDRRFSKINQKINEIVDGLNLTPEQQATLKEQTLEARLRTLEDHLSSEGGEAATSQPQTSPDFVDVFKKAGIDPNSVEAVEMATMFKDDPIGLMNAIVSKIAKAPTTPPAAASVTQPSSGGAAPQADLQTQYNQELANLRQGDVSALHELKRKYRGKGLDIW